MIQDDEELLPEVLRTKWEHDKAGTDWRRLTLLRGRWWKFDSLSAVAE
jgi:hypothetical protein